MANNSISNGVEPHEQRSIRSFFQPRTPNYTAPPDPAAATSRSIAPTNSGSILPPKVSNSVSQKSEKSNLPPQASVSAILETHVQPLRRINSLLLPINYPDSFYHKVLESSNTPSNFSRVILWVQSPSTEPKVIGGIVCRLDPAFTPESTPTTSKFIPNAFDIYVQSLALLSPYRSQGLATAVLDSVVEAAIAQNSSTIRQIYAHVWTENREGLEWYVARGFKIDEGVVQGYYKRLKPDTALILRRRLNPSDHLAHSSTVTHSCQASKPIVKPAPLILNPASPMTSALQPPSAGRPPMPNSARSFQDKGPEQEWNDLPDEVLTNSLLRLPSAAGSATSSRSSSRSGAGKKKRQYPAAAFGS